MRKINSGHLVVADGISLDQFGPAPIVESGPVYDTDAQAYFNAMAVQPDATRKGLLNDLITGLKTDNVWSKILWMSIASHTAQAFRINMKTPAQVATEVNAPTYTVDQGYAGDGVSAYLETNVAGTALTATDTSLFILPRVQSAIRTGNIGYRAARHTLMHGGSTLTQSFLVSAATSLSTTNATNGQFACASRTGTSQTLQIGTTVEDTDVVSTDTLNNTNTIRILAASATFCTAQLSMAGFGLHLNNTDATNLRARVRTYLIAIGAI